MLLGVFKMFLDLTDFFGKFAFSISSIISVWGLHKPFVEKLRINPNRISQIILIQKYWIKFYINLMSI